MDFEHLPHAELLAAYLDGEATPDERALVDRLLAEQPEYQQLAAELQALSGTLASLPKPRLGVDLSSAVLSEIAARQAASAAPVVSTAPVTAPAAPVVAASGEESPNGRAEESDWFERLPLATAPRTGARFSWWTVGVLVSAAALLLMMFAAQPWQHASNVTQVDDARYNAAPRATTASPARSFSPAAADQDAPAEFSDSLSKTEREPADVRLRLSPEAGRGRDAESYHFDAPTPRSEFDQPAPAAAEMSEDLREKETQNAKDTLDAKKLEAMNGGRRPASVMRSKSNELEALGERRVPALPRGASPAPVPAPDAMPANAEAVPPPRPAAVPAGRAMKSVAAPSPAEPPNTEAPSEQQTPTRALQANGLADADRKSDHFRYARDGADFYSDEVLVVELQVTPQAVQSGQFNGQLNQWFVENRIAFSAPAADSRMGRKLLETGPRPLDRAPAAEAGQQAGVAVSAPAAGNEPSAGAELGSVVNPAKKAGAGDPMEADDAAQLGVKGPAAGQPAPAGESAPSNLAASPQTPTNGQPFGTLGDEGGRTYAGLGAAQAGEDVVHLGLYVVAEPAQIDGLLGDLQAKNRGPVTISNARWAKLSPARAADGAKPQAQAAAPGPASLYETWEGFGAYLNDWVWRDTMHREAEVKAKAQAPGEPVAAPAVTAAAGGVAGAAMPPAEQPADLAVGAGSVAPSEKSLTELKDEALKRAKLGEKAEADAEAGVERFALSQRAAGRAWVEGETATGVASLVQITSAQAGLNVFFATPTTETRVEAADKLYTSFSRGLEMRYGESLQFVAPVDQTESAKQSEQPLLRFDVASDSPTTADAQKEMKRSESRKSDEAPTATLAPAASAKPASSPPAAPLEAPAPPPPPAPAPGDGVNTPVTAPAPMIRTGDGSKLADGDMPKGNGAQPGEAKREEAAGSKPGDVDGAVPLVDAAPRRRVLFLLKLAAPQPSVAAESAVPVADEALPAAPVPAGPVPASPVPAGPAPASPAAPQ